MAEFTGAVRCRPFGGGASFPFGHLEFDYTSLVIHGAWMRLAVDKSEVRFIRIARRLWVTRVGVINTDGSRPDEYFVTYDKRGVCDALVARGWPIHECRF